MLAKNKAILDFTGVSKFHEAGYFGKRVTVATGEQLSVEQCAEMGHKVISPIDGWDGFDGHGMNTALTLWEVAPEATLVTVPYNENVGINGKIYTFNEDILPILADNNVTLMTLSMLDYPDVLERDKALAKYPNLFFGAAAGNDGYQCYNALTDCKYVYGIGALWLLNGKPYPADYSSASDTVDFSAPTDIYVPAVGDGIAYYFNGTSAATPFFIGMLTLVQDFFIDKTGKPLTRDMMYQFIKDHSYDFYESGKDTKTGWGYIVLPDPETIDIGRYAPLEIKMKINSNKMTVNGETKVLDQAPIIAPTGRTLAPVRAVFEAAGLTVEWNAATQEITATR